MTDRDEEIAEVVYEEDGRRYVERVPDGYSSFPSAIQRLGRVFRLRRREVVSRSGELTHMRVTYRSAKDNE